MQLDQPFKWLLCSLHDFVSSQCCGRQLVQISCREKACLLFDTRSKKYLLLFYPIARLLDLKASSSTTWHKIEKGFGSKGNGKWFIGEMCESTVLGSLLHVVFTSVATMLIVCTTRFLLQRFISQLKHRRQRFCNLVRRSNLSWVSTKHQSKH